MGRFSDLSNADNNDCFVTVPKQLENLEGTPLEKHKSSINTSVFISILLIFIRIEVITAIIIYQLILNQFLSGL